MLGEELGLALHWIWVIISIHKNLNSFGDSSTDHSNPKHYIWKYHWFPYQQARVENRARRFKRKTNGKKEINTRRQSLRTGLDILEQSQHKVGKLLPGPSPRSIRTWDWNYSLRPANKHHEGNDKWTVAVRQPTVMVIQSRHITWLCKQP